MSRQSPGSVVHVVVWKQKRKISILISIHPLLSQLFLCINARVGALTCAGGAVGVVAGVRGRSVAPQAGVALAVGAGGVARCAAELGRAAAGADGSLAGEEPTSDCGVKKRE